MLENQFVAPVTSLPEDFDPNSNAVDNAIDLLIRNRDFASQVVLAITKVADTKAPNLIDESGDKVAIVIRTYELRGNAGYQRDRSNGSLTMEGLTSLVARESKFRQNGGNPIERMLALAAMGDAH